MKSFKEILKEELKELGVKSIPRLKNTFDEIIPNRFDEIQSSDINGIQTLQQRLKSKIDEYTKQLEILETLNLAEEVDIISPPYLTRKENYQYLLAKIESYKDTSMLKSLLYFLDNVKINNIPTLPFLDILYHIFFVREELEYFFNSTFNNSTIIKNKTNFQDDKYQKKIYELESMKKELEYYCGAIPPLRIPTKPKDLLVGLQELLEMILLKDIKNLDIKKCLDIVIEDLYPIARMDKKYSKSRQRQLEELSKKLTKRLQK